MAAMAMVVAILETLVTLGSATVVLKVVVVLKVAGVLKAVLKVAGV